MSGRRARDGSMRVRRSDAGRRSTVASACVLLALVLATVFGRVARSDEPNSAASSISTEPIAVVADSVRSWSQNDERIVLLEGNVYIAQGLTRLRAEHAAVWIRERPGESDKLTRLEVYAEGNVRTEDAWQRGEAATHLQSLQTKSTVQFQMKHRETKPAVDDPVYQRGDRRRRGDHAPSAATQLTSFQSVNFAVAGLVQGGERRLRLFSRTQRPFQFDTFRVSEEEQALVLTGGVNAIIDNVQGVGTLDVLADRMVLWTRTADAPRVGADGATQSADTPLEMYLEGNVYVRQGPRTLECNRMYYDVRRNLYLATDATIESINEVLGNPVFMRARELRQVAQDRYIARGIQLSPSRFAPTDLTYESQTSSATIEGVSGTVTNPETGEPEPRIKHHVSGVDNFFYIEQVPVFYWPFYESTLEDMSTPLRKITVGHSGSYGTFVRTTWDGFQLFPWIEKPQGGTRWDVDFDFLSERGPAAGTYLEYRGKGLFGIDEPHYGIVDAYVMGDHGTDNLADGRRNIDPEQDVRGRFLWRHRQILPDDLSLTLEFSYISDINFLEQFFEHEWEEDKDQETLLYLKQQRDNWAWSVTGRARINDFVTTTDQLPQLDLYLLGEPLLDDRLTYFMHSSLGYLEFLDMDRSNGDIAPFAEGPTHVGLRGDSSHEIDWPFSLGPVKVVPFALGRATGWTNTFDGRENRLYGALGVRTSMPLWRVYPEVESDLFNLHGLAHKMVFSIDYYLAQANRDHTLFPLYDELEDDSEQVFRRRFIFRDYAGALPPGLDPQSYAIRTGLMTSAESVDDLQAVRFDSRQRLQTKRGVPGDRHVVDWMTLDTSVTFFPQEVRDNFGENFGLYTYDYSWHIGDRTSILSSGWFESYHDGPRAWSAGVLMERPPRGSIYLGFTSLDPVDSRVLQFSYNYWMSPKWMSSFTTSYDFGETKNLGQSLVVTRIGADLVLRLGLNWNPLRDNFGIGFEIEPRLDPQLRLGSLHGGRVPVESAPIE